MNNQSERRKTMKAAPTTANAMAEHWNGRAHRFNPAASHLRHRDQWRGVLAAALGTESKDAVDLGCGTGACAILLAELGHRVRGVDGSSAMLGFARAEAQERGLDVSFIHSTMDDARLEDQSADVVTIRNVLWTLENPEGALSLARRILRPGGTLLVADGLWYLHRPNNSAAEFGVELPFFSGLAAADVGAMLERIGFEVSGSWADCFDSHPYGTVYDDTTRMIEFFVLTALKP
jgi:ubiquinone/menaquinone biosynthesis C-methylase UbiE